MTSDGIRTRNTTFKFQKFKNDLILNEIEVVMSV